MTEFLFGLKEFLYGVVTGAVILYGWQHRTQVRNAVDRLREWIHRP